MDATTNDSFESASGVVSIPTPAQDTIYWKRPAVLTRAFQFPPRTGCDKNLSKTSLSIIGFQFPHPYRTRQPLPMTFALSYQISIPTPVQDAIAKQHKRMSHVCDIWRERRSNSQRTDCPQFSAVLHIGQSPRFMGAKSTVMI
jgi:hypothetical protein